MRAAGMILALLAAPIMAPVIAPVMAQEMVPFPADALPVGTLVVYRYDNGAVQVREVRKNGPEGITTAMLSSAREAPLQSIIISDAQGRRLELLFPDGRQYEYEPHDCTRVIGACRYSIVASNGRRVERLHDAELSDGTLTTTVSDLDGIALTRSVAEFDETGMLTRVVHDNLRAPAQSFAFTLTAIIPPKP